LEKEILIYRTSESGVVEKSLGSREGSPPPRTKNKMKNTQISLRHTVTIFKAGHLTLAVHLLHGSNQS